MKTLPKLRSDIDKIDATIACLLNKRAGFVLKVGHLKKNQGIPIYDSKREERVLKRVRVIGSKGPFGSEAVEKVFTLIIQISSNLEEELKRK